MTSLSLAIGRPTLADRLFSRGVVMDLVLLTAGAAFTAIAAQVQIPLWPVPITGQTLAVLLVGSSLGALRGALSMTLYSVLGLVGLPVFSNATSGVEVAIGPTGGYLIGFVFAAAFTGWMAQRSWDRRVLRAILAFLGGTVVIYLIALPWLAASLGLGLQDTLELGMYRFVVGDTVKMLIATGVIAIAWKHVERDDRRRADAELSAD